MISSIVLMVMNHSSEAHANYTVAFWYFHTKFKKNKSSLTALKHVPSVFSCRTICILQFRNPASRQSREIDSSGNQVIFKDAKHIVVGLFNSPTTINQII